MLVSLVSFMNAVARTGGLFNVIPVLAHDRLGLNADRIGLGLALASLVGLVVIYPSGVLVDRYGRKSVIVPATFMAGIFPRALSPRALLRLVSRGLRGVERGLGSGRSGARGLRARMSRRPA